MSALSAPVRSGLELALARRLLPNLPSGAFVLASYRAVGEEVDPAPVEAALPLANIALPRVSDRNGPLSFHASPLEALQPGAFGIPEPPPSAPMLVPDVLLIPLLVVDAVGNRLGQGGGFYDRTLARLRAERPVVAIGMAWDVQRVGRLDAAPWDAPLDAVATPSAFQWFDDLARRKE